ncbi:hypothetical protein I302_102930 [Kwoniella bestiolae CBS 10118]|uniref:Uncharacterized protein n=1 Tax=Kwoniella bestiolae CBS 10118 TaxID=1296100 RepID=A0A1B9GGK2_9TREE|nr:hypothetical protein I302_01626 [Kwoniella bestiolae CBS 10118]OCF30107.1 hypothetical protein I302_01626 [Kwoniella bestiolae CBS 10118]
MDLDLMGGEDTSSKLDEDLSELIGTLPDVPFVDMSIEALMEEFVPPDGPPSQVKTDPTSSTRQEWTKMQDILYGPGEDRFADQPIPFASGSVVQSAQQASDPTSPSPYNQAHMPTEHRENAQPQHEPPHAASRPVWHKKGDLLRNLR